MNTREFLHVVAETAADAGMDGTVSSVEVQAGKPKPWLIVLEAPGRISPETAERLHATVPEALKDTPFAGLKVFVLGDGLTFTVLDETGKAMNRRLRPLPHTGDKLRESPSRSWWSTLWGKR